jgi:alpha-galactosidase
MNLADSWFEALAGYQPGAGLLATPARQGREWSVRLDNIAARPMPLAHWLLFDGAVAEPSTPIYGEGFQMLAQTDGAWGAPQAIGRCPDASVYRITPDVGYHTVHNVLLYRQGGSWLLLGFASCQRFGGEFRLYPDGRLQIVMNSEGLVLAPGAHWQSESLVVLQGEDKQQLLGDFSRYICHHHAPLSRQRRATGWCSWYHYYAEVTSDDIQENLQQLQSRFPALEYVQIDDGYQHAMGDWLIPSSRFEGGLTPLLEAIHAAGREPALWVAPFIAESGSQLFQQHPEWFIQDDQGKPLPAEKVTYGGWRCTPWYVLDGTKPEVQEHLQTLFRTLRQEHGIRYFKLDANFWGAMHGGRLNDRHATRIEAYRRGMAAILAGVGDDAFLLGCNAPLWPSLGLVHGMRVADDVERQGHRIRQIAKEIFSRNWQADCLWQLDPDCLCLLDIPGQSATPEEYSFHAAVMAACGGILLLGDRLLDLGPQHELIVAGLQRLAEVNAPAAQFDDDQYRQGVIPWQQGLLCCYFNWQPSDRTIELPVGSRDFWSNEALIPGPQILSGHAGLVIWHPVTR